MLAVAARSSSPSPRALASTGRRPVLVAVALPPRAAPPRAPLLARAASAPRAPLPGPRVLAGALAAPAPAVAIVLAAPAVRAAAPALLFYFISLIFVNIVFRFI